MNSSFLHTSAFSMLTSEYEDLSGLVVFKTRQDAEIALNECHHWSALFDVMVGALSSNRTKWGDGEEWIRRATFEWSMLNFLIASPTQSVLKKNQSSNSTSSLEGDLLIDASFCLAKKVSQLLISPIKDSMEWIGIQEDLLSWTYGLKNQKICRDFGIPFDKGGLLLCSSSFIKTSNGVFIKEDFFNQVSSELFENLLEMDQFLSSGYYHCWDGSPPNYLEIPNDKENLSALSTPSLSQEDLNQCCEELGLSHLRMSPAGGWKAACCAIIEFQEASYALADFLNAPRSIVGQNELAVSLNENRFDLLAWYGTPHLYRPFPLLAFSVNVSNLGHEWVHAMEEKTQIAIKNNPTCALGESYGGLHPDLNNLHQDQELRDEYLKSLSEKIHTFLKRSHQKIVSMVKEDGFPKKATNFWDQENKDLQASIWIRYCSFLELAHQRSGHPLEKTEIEKDFQKWIGGFCKTPAHFFTNQLQEYSELKKSLSRQAVLLQQKKPVFFVEAWESTTTKRWTIGDGNEDVEYYMQPKELLARLAEGVFHQSNLNQSYSSRRFAYVQVGDYSCPLKKELSDLRPAFMRWMNCICDEWIKEITPSMSNHHLTKPVVK